MSPMDAGPVLALLGLGALHGLNPGMGWLFAVALGLQERDRRAVWRAIPPLALGHGAAIALALAAAMLVGRVLPAEQLTWAVGVTLVGFGAYRLVRHRHPRGGCEWARATSPSGLCSWRPRTEPG